VGALPLTPSTPHTVAVLGSQKYTDMRYIALRGKVVRRSPTAALLRHDVAYLMGQTKGPPGRA